LGVSGQSGCILTNPIALVAHEKEEIKVERVILDSLDSLKDHLICLLFEKKATKYMFDALAGLF
jgi:hypothetical protein